MKAKNIKVGDEVLLVLKVRVTDEVGNCLCTDFNGNIDIDYIKRTMKSKNAKVFKSKD